MFSNNINGVRVSSPGELGCAVTRQSKLGCDSKLSRIAHALCCLKHIILTSITVWKSNIYVNLSDNMARVRISLGLATNIDFEI
jgi:hypothetical protein